MGNTDCDIKNKAKYKLNYSQHKAKQNQIRETTTKITKNSYEMFSCMEDFITEIELCFDIIKPIIIDDLVSSESNLQQYFVPESDMSRFHWIQNPFNVEIK